MTRHWYINEHIKENGGFIVFYYGTDEYDLAIQVEKLCETYERTGKSAVIEYGYEECSDYQRIVIEDGVVVKRKSCF